MCLNIGFNRRKYDHGRFNEELTYEVATKSIYDRSLWKLTLGFLSQSKLVFPSGLFMLQLTSKINCEVLIIFNFKAFSLRDSVSIGITRNRNRGRRPYLLGSARTHDMGQFFYF